jgi:outer membrane protein assembly factor BamA
MSSDYQYLLSSNACETLEIVAQSVSGTGRHSAIRFQIPERTSSGPVMYARPIYQAHELELNAFEFSTRLSVSTQTYPERRHTQYKASYRRTRQYGVYPYQMKKELWNCTPSSYVSILFRTLV